MHLTRPAAACQRCLPQPGQSCVSEGPDAHGICLPCPHACLSSYGPAWHTAPGSHLVHIVLPRPPPLPQLLEVLQRPHNVLDAALRGGRGKRRAGRAEWAESCGRKGRRGGHGMTPAQCSTPRHSLPLPTLWGSRTAGRASHPYTHQGAGASPHLHERQVRRRHSLHLDLLAAGQRDDFKLLWV